MIVASIVEREAVQDEEKPLIASVYLNRLNIGMNSDADPTIQYALGFDFANGTWWKNPLSLDDLQFDSPFNTYLYTGLSAPISTRFGFSASPVAFPQTYYFRASVMVRVSQLCRNVRGACGKWVPIIPCNIFESKPV